MHAPKPPRKTVKAASGATPWAFAALIGANGALAVGPWFVRVADTGPVASGFWRLALAAPLLAILAMRGGWRPVGLGRKLWIVLAISGLCFAADLACWNLGILRTTLANSTLFGNSAILFFPIYGFFVARAWPTRSQGLALLLALAGAVLLMGRSYQLDPRHLFGDMLCLVAGMLYTVYFVCMARARDTMSPFPALALSTIASIVPILVFAIALGERVMPHNWWPLLGIALVSQVIGQSLMIYALGRFSPLVVGIALLTQPVIAATIGWLVYGERLGLPDLVGGVLVAIALVLVREGPKELDQLAAEPEATR
jgi:drug/metabolite transporter (DMT)-like permease